MFRTTCDHHKMEIQSGGPVMEGLCVSRCKLRIKAWQAPASAAAQPGGGVAMKVSRQLPAHGRQMIALSESQFLKVLG